MSVLDHFLKYVSFDTQSDEHSATAPSTAKQKVLGQALAEELGQMGLQNAHMDEYGYVYGWLPATPGCEGVPCLGLIAHMDTAPSAPGVNVKPRVVHYEGGDVQLSETMVMKAAEFDCLKKVVGHDLVVTDGTTLLGADDKAGIAEIVTAVEYLIAHPEVKHGKVAVAFTPDEEIGRGTDHFDVSGFGAAAAYTVDGGSIGGIEYENFNAAQAEVTVHGFNIHPGGAKNKMRSAILMAIEFNSMLPPAMIPAHTEGFEGFFHLNHLEGDETTATMTYIVRDHDMAKFEAKKAMLEKIAAYLNDKYGAGTIDLDLRDQYFNMKREIEPHMYLIHKANAAYRKQGVEPHSVAIRGGTDGAMLSYKGLPCPNLSTGGYNAHGPMEFASVQEMEKMVEVLVTILQVEDV